ncbi:MAG: flagellar biosynthetic protein FliR [Deltaproteobacteria bacterium]|jgi:flagellar biosynthetic protein FliR|nr:flagellar biosynthetic protein FliR [Deltaproteobacteria bacterium]
MGAPNINAAEFSAFVLVLIRLSMVVAMAPIIGSPNILTEAKAALSLTLALVIAPTVSYDASLMPMTLWHLVVLGAGEAAVGLLLATMVRLVLETANLAGEYLSFQMSLTMVNLMDPQSGTQVPIVSRLVYIIFVLIFLFANGHFVVLKALSDSFKAAPVGLLVLDRPEIFTEVMKAAGRMYILAVKIAAPVVGLLFCVKVSFGIVAKAVPQMQVLFVGMPLYILAGLGLIGLSMDFWPRLIGQGLFEAQEALKRVLEFLAPIQTGGAP